MRAARGNLLLLDNRDSFVWNLAQALLDLGARVDVVRSDRITLDEIAARRPRALVLSPGPGRPEDAGVCVAAIRHLHGRLPILGVCLGHQAIGLAHGGEVVRTGPCHGRATAVHHDGTGLFASLPSPLPAARYHSLAIATAPWPDALRACAHTADGVVMAVQHRSAPTFGVQFHPESFLTPHGKPMLAAFLAVAA